MVRPALVIALMLALTLAPAPLGAETTIEYDRKSDNIEVVARAQFPQATDMFFQRREGPHTVDGRTAPHTRDYLFVGSDASSAAPHPAEIPRGVRVYDVTEPTQPQLLANVDCPGYHADVAVYEDLLIHGVDSRSSNTGCAEEHDPLGVDRAGVAGVRIFDISDPADPTVVAFLDAEELGTDPHNITTLPWAGLLYIAGSEFTRTEPVMTIVDLAEPGFPVETMPMRDISPSAVAECHDIGVAELGDRDLAFCAAVEQTFIWDITNPHDPVHVSIVVGPPESIHHAARLAPDGRTLVLNDELGGAAVAPGCLPTDDDPIGALHFFDIAVPEEPVYLSSFSTSEADAKLPCTSHFYNFIPGEELLTIGWYESGVIVVDYGNRLAPTEHAVLTPTGGDFWAAYYWRGFIYGSSFGGEGLYGGKNHAGGVWIAQLEGVGDHAPSHFDMGLTWAPWSGPGKGSQKAPPGIFGGPST